MKAGTRRRKTTPAFQPGMDGIATAIILSCPGKVEAEKGYPAAGVTGENLEKLLAEGHKRNKSHFPSERKKDYRIINSCETVYPNETCKRTQPLVSEIIDPNNLKRVRKDLRGIRVLVALGKRAQRLLDELDEPESLYVGRHPSMQSLNTKYRSNKKTPNQRAEERLEKYIAEVQAEV